MWAYKHYSSAVYTCQRSCVTSEFRLFYRLYKAHVTTRMLLYRKLAWWAAWLITNYSTSSLKKIGTLPPSNSLTLGSNFYALIGVENPSLAQSNLTPQNLWSRYKVGELHDSERTRRIPKTKIMYWWAARKLIVFEDPIAVMSWSKLTISLNWFHTNSRALDSYINGIRLTFAPSFAIFSGGFDL